MNITELLLRALVGLGVFGIAIGLVYVGFKNRNKDDWDDHDW